jgi:hypothetical protein
MKQKLGTPKYTLGHKGDVSCPSSEFIYIYFSFTLSRTET